MSADAAAYFFIITLADFYVAAALRRYAMLMPPYAAFVIFHAAADAHVCSVYIYAFASHTTRLMFTRLFCGYVAFFF